MNQENNQNMKTCSNCGAQNYVGAAFCNNCGRPYYPINNLPPKQKKNKLPIIIGILVFLILIVLLSFIFLIGNNKNSKTDGKRTILLYIVGSNLESENAAATVDLEEIKKSGINIDENRIVIYTGGSKKWTGQYNNNAIYELTKSGYTLVKQYNESNMADPNTLTTFIDYVTDNYNSSKYGLILWDHGAGPIGGFGQDEITGNIMGLNAINRALNNSKYLKNNKFEFIGFDACLMASVEVGKTLSKYTDYLIASEEVEPGYGWDYSFLKEINSNTDAVTLGKAIIDYTHNFYQKTRRTYYTTLSLLDLTKVGKVEDCISELFKNVDFTDNYVDYSDIVRYVTKATSFGYNGEDNSYDLIDLKQLSESLEENYGKEAKNLTKAIDEMVIYQKTNIKGANGVSIYYPYYTKSVLNDFMKIYNSIDFSNEYKAYLKRYVNVLTGDKLVTDSKTLSIQKENNELSVTLDGDLLSNFNAASYVLYLKVEEDGTNYYMPVYTSSDVTLNKDTGVLTANYNGKHLALLLDGEEYGYASMFQQYVNEDEVVYRIPISIYKKLTPEEGYWTLKTGNILFQVSKDNPEGKVMAIVPKADPNDVSSSRTEINLDDWDTIIFNNVVDKYFDENGNFNEQGIGDWIAYQVIVETNENFELKLVDNTDEEYYIAFNIADTQGNTYHSSAIKVK